jgi:hypothetical protein
MATILGWRAIRVWNSAACIDSQASSATVAPSVSARN